MNQLLLNGMLFVLLFITVLCFVVPPKAAFSSCNSFCHFLLVFITSVCLMLILVGAQLKGFVGTALALGGLIASNLICFLIYRRLKQQ